MKAFKVNFENWNILFLCGSFILIFQCVLLMVNSDLVELKINLILQTLLLMFFLWWLYKTTGSFFNCPAIFLVSLYYWNSAWFFCHYFKVSPLFEYTGRVFHYGVAEIPQAIALISMCLSCTILGVVAGYDQEKRAQVLPVQWKGNQGDSLSRKIVYLVLALYTLLTIVYLIKIGIGFFDTTYNEITRLIQPHNSLIYRLYHSTRFYMLLIVITVFAYMRKAEYGYIFMIFSGMILLQFLMGSRIMPFMTLIACIVCFDHFIKRQTWATVLIFLVGIAFVSCMVVNCRAYIGMGWNVFNLPALKSAINQAALTHTISPEALKHPINLWQFIWDAQQGGIVARTIHFVSERGHCFYGQSIIDSLVYLFPRFIVDGLGFHTGFVTPNDWIVAKSTDIPFGGNLGFSLVAEAYFNFGMAGCLMFLVVGWVLGKYYFKYVFSKDIYSLLHVLNFSLNIALGMQGIIGTYMRYLVYGFLFIELLRMMDKRTCK